MSRLRVHRRKDGVRVVHGLTWFAVAMLLDLPSLVSGEFPEAVEKRLFPDPSDDESHRTEWRRTVRPDLFALLASAREIVERDLRSIRPERGDPGARGWRLEIRPKHVHAWLSALQAARLHLGEIHHFSEMEIDDGLDFAADAERGLALMKLDVLTALQGALVLNEMPEPDAPPDLGPPPTA